MQTINGLDLAEGLDEWADPARTALLIYDVQVGICGQIDSGAVIAATLAVIKAARAAGMRIVFTRHLSLPTKWMGRMAYRTAMSWQRTKDPAQVAPWFLRDSSGYALIPELAPQADEAVFDKIAMSAFEGTPLQPALRDCGIEALAIAGIALEIGIEPTARHAADLGFVPILIEDACGHGNAEAAARSLEQMRFTGDVVLTTSAQFVAALSSNRTASGRACFPV